MHALNEGTTFTSKKLDASCPEITLYRVVQLLVELCNDVLGSLLFLFLLACGTSQVVSAVTTILYASSIDVFVALFFTVMVFETSLIYMVVYGLAGNFYRASELSLLELNKHATIHLNKIVERKERKQRKKFLKSCQVQKVKFGLSNFIEKTTPPMFQLYCLERIIDLLLVQ